MFRMLIHRWHRLLVLAGVLGAALVYAQPATVTTCGPGQAGCGPATVLGGVTTTTLPATAAPSWVSSMMAAWMLDETSGTRVNLQGTTSRDFANVDSSDPGSSTDHQEGTRSISLTAPQARHTTDTFSGLVAPLSMGCWTKQAATPSNDSAILMHHFAIASGTARLDRLNTGEYKFTCYDSSAAPHLAKGAVVTNNVWHHVAGTMTNGGSVKLYVDGVLAGTIAMGTAAASLNPVYVGDNNLYTGLIDECWIANLAPNDASICRICSCGIRGEQCTCSGTAFATTGRNTTACGSCTLPADCSAAAPS